MDDCIFCKIIKGELPSTIVVENDFGIVIRNIEPIVETHVLVIPKKHVSNFMDLGDETRELTQLTQLAVKNLNIENGYKLVVNGGKYQTVPHFHIHILAGTLEATRDILNRT